MSKPRVDPKYRRVLVYGRVYPKTLAYLQSLGQPNLGRAIDYIAFSHMSIMRGMKAERRAQFDPPAPLPLTTAS